MPPCIHATQRFEHERGERDSVYEACQFTAANYANATSMRHDKENTQLEHSGPIVCGPAVFK